MTFKTRLIGLSIGQVLAMSSLAVLGVIGINKISQQAHEATAETVEVALEQKAPELALTHMDIELLLNADRDAYQALKAERDALEATDLEGWEQALSDNLENAGQVRDRVSKAGQALPDSAVALQARVLDLQAKWQRATEAVVRACHPDSDASKRGKYAELSAASRVLFDEMRDGIDALVGIQEERIVTLTEGFAALREDAKAAAEDVEHVAQSSRWTFGLVAGITSAGLIAATVLMILSLTRGLDSIIQRLREIADGDGDLTRRVEQDRRDELGRLGKAFNDFVRKVHDLVASVRGASGEVSQASVHISSCMDDMAVAMNDELARAQQISAAAEEMNASIAEVAAKAEQADATSVESGQVATDGGQVVRQTVDDMQSIADTVQQASASIESLLGRSEQIGHVINVINDIADQTNLLALNAAIEAARAGEHGRGFAVVADEVRKLADRTTTATQEIAESIRSMQAETAEAMDRMTASRDRVTSGVDRAGQAGAALQTIVASATSVTDIVRAIAVASREQAAASDEVSRSVSDISTGMQRVSQTASDSTRVVSQLAAKSDQLHALISKFKLLAEERRVDPDPHPPAPEPERRRNPDELAATLASDRG